MSDYKLTISKKELLGMLSDYYSNQIGSRVEVKEKHRIETVGYYESREAVVEIFYEQKINILNHIATKTTKLSEEDVKDALGELLGDSGFKIKNLTFQSGITTEGYGIYDEYDVAYFSGIELSLEESQMKLTRK